MRICKSARWLGGACLIGLASAATAQEQNAEQPDDGGLPDIVVTANRRAEDSQRVSLAVTKLDTEELIRSNIRSVADLQFFVPGLVFSQNGAAFTTLRGVGTSQPGSAVEAGVATFVDSVYIGRASAVQAYYDLESVEVLRGPQGTLFGRNATGGAILINSAKPTEDLSAGLIAGYGNYNRVNIEGFASGSLGGGFSARIAGIIDERDSYRTNIVPDGPKIPGDELNAIRGTLQYQPEGSELVLRLVADYQSFSSAGQLPQNFLGAASVSPSAPPGTIFTTDPHRTAQSLPNRADRESWGLNYTMEAPIGSLTLRSITGYRENKWRAENSLSTSSDPRSFTRTDETASQFSQEIQLLSDDQNRLKWVVGAYYYREDAIGRYDLQVVSIEQLQLFPGFSTGPIQFRQNLTQDISSQSYAVFGEANYSLTDRFRVILGARYTRDDKKGRGLDDSSLVDLGGILGTIPIGGIATVDDSWDAFTPKLALEYDLAEQTLLYASVTRGFKPGNSNLTVGQNPVRPEFIWAYEAGLKARAFDNRAQFNLVGFYYDYTDLQAFGVISTGNGGLSAGFQNAAAATVKGFEAEVLAQPIPNLTLSGFYAYLDATYDRFTNTDSFQDALAPPTVVLDGNTMPRSPKHTINLAAQYDASVGNFTVSPRVEFVHRSKMYFSEFERDLTAQPAFSLWNARLTVGPERGNWSVAIYGRNLTDEAYFETVNEGPNGNAGAFYGAPRTYGVELRLRY